MKKDNLIRDKTFEFAVRIVNLYKFLTSDRREMVMSKQLLRAGTSIGANLEEAIASISKKEFIAKCQISYKEAFEASFWLRLLYRTDYLSEKECESLHQDNEEIIKILTTILKKTKEGVNINY